MDIYHVLSKNNKVPIIKLFDDESGDKIVLELLGTIKYKRKRYVFLTPHFEDEEDYDIDSPVDVFIMTDTAINGEKALETVGDDKLRQKAYAIYKEKYIDVFEFKD